MVANAFFDQQKVCPVCQKSFTITRVRSSACYVIKRESDFNVIYRDVNPVHYAVWVCPHCQYAAPEKNFSDDLRPAELDRLKKGLALLRTKEPEFQGERTPATALRAFELAIRSAQIRQAGPGYTAGLFLRSAWICRELGRTSQEQEYLAEALKYYKESFEKEVNLSTRLSDVRLMYIVGELNHRLGNLDEAIQWFSRAVMNRDLKREPELERQLRDQWEIAREKRKKIGSGSIEPEVDNQNSDDDTSTTIVLPTDRNSMKMIVSLFDNQMDWLNSISECCYNKTKAHLTTDAVLRAMLDALILRNLEIEGADSEENLTKEILAKLK